MKKTTTKRPAALGRGLDALMDDPPDSLVAHRPAVASLGEDAREMPIDLLVANPDQPRTHFSEDALKELTLSIKASGVLQPILIRPCPGPEEAYQVVAGERRWRAAQRAGLHTVPVLVRREVDDRQALLYGLVENLQRSDLNPVEEARGYQNLLVDTDQSHEAVAELVGKSRAHVTNMLRLLQLPGSVLRHLESGTLTAGHARPLVGHKKAEALANKIAKEKLSVRDAERLARRAGTPRKGGRTTPGSSSGSRDADTAELEEGLSAAIGLKVRIVDQGGKGELRIAYNNYQELDRLSESLSDVPSG